jgi:beta-lactamase regulating signal transducer with metallopeptidase domain
MAEETWLQETLLSPFSGPEWSRLVLTLGHSLWQGAAVVVFLAMILRCCDGRKSRIRYATCVAALLAVPLTSILTWTLLSHVDNGATTANAISANSPNGATHGSSESELLTLTEPELGESGNATGVPLRSTIDGIPVEPFRRDAAASSSEFLATSLLSPLAAVAWVAGVLLMLARLVTQILAGRCLSQAMLPADRETTSLVSQLAKKLGIRKQIRVTISDHLRSPAIMGAFWPVLFLPGSMMTGLTAEQLKVVIIHELAHIRRHDYLVNIGQMLIESVLFFNPAVWWISRQLRIEREACADSIAVSESDNPLEYATVLAAFAESLVGHEPPTLAQTLSRRRNTGSIADRIRRVLSPTAIPNLRIHWASLCGALILSTVAVFATEKGTQVVVQYAARLLTPKERMDVLVDTREKIEEAAKVIGPSTRRELKGTIETTDGSPLPVRGDANVHLPAKHQGFGVSWPSNGSETSGDFSWSLPFGDAYIHIFAEGYAPATLGPIPAGQGPTVKGLKLTLRRRSPAEIVLADEKGLPVGHAQITAGYRCHGMRSQLLRLTSNSLGVAQVDHPGELPYYEFEIRRDGFEMLSFEKVLLDPKQPYVIRMKKARPMTGAVVDSNGQPVVKASIQLFGSETDEANSYRPEWHGEELTITDGAGKFTLDTLISDRHYKLEVHTESQGRYILDNVQAGQKDRSFQLPPELVFQGTVTGDLSRILLKETDVKGFLNRRTRELLGTPQLRYTIEELGNEGLIRGVNFVPVSIEDGVGRFEIKNLIPGDVKLCGGDRSTLIRLTEPVEDFNFHIDEGPTRGRKMILEFTTPEGQTPQGTVLVHVRRPDPSTRPIYEFLPIKDGKVELDCFAPGTVSYEAHRVIGYCFNRAQVTVDVGSNVIRHTVPVFPAGAITGHVRDAGGGPVSTSVAVDFGTIEQSPDAKGHFGIWGQIEVKPDGQYFLSPIPLGGSYFVYAKKDAMFAAVGPVRLTAAKPASNVNIVMPRGVHIQGKVIDKFNRPLRGIPVRYNLSHFTLSSGTLPVETDDSGVFDIGPINPDVREHSVVVNSRKNYQSTRVVVEDLKKPIIVRLEIGKRAAGVVLDRTSGWPIPNAEVYARSEDHQIRCEAETRTDSNGQFRFSNLPDKQMKFVVRGAKPFEASEDIITSKPGNMKMTFRVEANSELKPREPR